MMCRHLLPLLVGILWAAPAHAQIVAAPSGAPENGVVSLAVAPDGKRAISGHQKGQVVLWRHVEGQPLRRTGLGRLDGAVVGAAWPVQKTAWFLTDAGELIRCDVPGKPVPVGRHEGGALVLAVSPDGTRAATGGVDGRICIWNLARETCERVLTEHEGAVEALSMTDVRLVSAGWDGRLHLWSVRSGRRRRSWRVDGHRWSAVALAKNGFFLAADYAGRLVGFHRKRRKPVLLSDERPHRQWIRTLDADPEGKRFLAAASAEGVLLHLDVADAETVDRREREVVPSVARFDGKGSWIWIGNFDGSVERVKLEKGRNP